MNQSSAGATANGHAQVPGRRATVRDVAALAGVSIKTVSRVVNNETNVRDATRERVLKAVADLDYQPHPAARGLAGRRTFSIGLLYESPHEFSYVQRLLEGAYAACDDHRHALMLCSSKDTVTLAMVSRFVRQTRVDGVLLTAPLCDRADITEFLVENRMAFVQISPSRSNPDWAAVAPDDFEAGCALTEHVLALGHRRIGFVEGDPRHGASHKRLAGHVHCLRGHGLHADPALVTPGCFDFESGRRGLATLSALDEPPTAIIACNDDTAAGVVVAAHEAAIAIPKELSVVGFDDSPTAMHTWPALTTVRQPISDIAYRATELLIAGIGGEPPRQETLPCELVHRSSLAGPGVSDHPESS